MTVDHRPTALITGASGGIGMELAKVFARHGHDLVLVARDKPALDELGVELTREHGVTVRSLKKDLSERHAPDELYRQIHHLGVEIGIIVNNAGLGVFGFFHEVEWESELILLQVNIIALTHLTKLFLKDMVRKRSGKILNVASTAAFQPGPLMSVYYASKAYVLHFSEAIANEVKGTGVIVSVLCPGPTKTDFQRRAAMEDSKLFAGRNVMPARKVAELGYKGLMAGKRVIIPGLRNKIVAKANRFAPRAFAANVVRHFQERKQ